MRGLLFRPPSEGSQPWRDVCKERIWRAEFGGEGDGTRLRACVHHLTYRHAQARGVTPYGNAQDGGSAWSVGIRGLFSDII